MYCMLYTITHCVTITGKDNRCEVKFGESEIDTRKRVNLNMEIYMGMFAYNQMLLNTE